MRLSKLRLAGRSAVVAAVLAAHLAIVPAATAESTLKVSLHSDLKIIDPVWTTALISTHHGFMIYDTLFALDEKLAVRPQMVDAWSVSEDKLTWTFTLRDGLEWHDGTPVTAEDCVASLKRWAARDGMAQKLMSFVGELKATDAKTFVMRLQEPYGLVLATLGKPTSNVPFMMPKRVAETDPNTQITDTTGSGPFIFKKDEWKPGEKAVYLKNPKYKPRPEPPSGFAGGKLAKVDRVEWIWIADPQTQVNALSNGEIDFIEAPPHDLLPLVGADPNIRFLVVAPMGRQYAFRFNVLHKPFDNAKIRQAVAYALNQKDFLQSTIGDSKYYVACKSLYPCGSPLETSKGWEDKLESNAAKAKELLQQAGYDGTPVVLMQSTDIASLSNLAPVAKSLLEKAGFKVDLQAMDWQTLVARRAKKDAPAAGGWNVYRPPGAPLTCSTRSRPISSTPAARRRPSAGPAIPSWSACAMPSPRRRMRPSKRYWPRRSPERAAEYPTHVILGQYLQPSAFRKNIEGVLVATNVVFWNVEKK